MHAKTKSLLDRSDSKEEVKAWVRAHMAGGKNKAGKAREPPMTVPLFREWMNDVFLPRMKERGGEERRATGAKEHQALK
jgi:hypothetical protein